MALPKFTAERVAADFKVCHDRVQLDTRQRVQFIDITELVSERVRRAGIEQGIVNVQTRHTTTGIVLNENEHHLLRDFRELLEAWAPRDSPYHHNDLDARRFQLISPDEQPNGDAHARALLLGASETLNVGSGTVELGTWQRLFFVELDGPRARTLSIQVMGASTEILRMGK